jgi:hypothetical protein
MKADASFIAAIASGIGVLVSFYFSLLSRQAAKSQQHLAGLGVTAEWLREVRAWAAEAIDLLSEAEYCVPPSQKNGPADSIGTCRHRLSAIIDRGRLIFPNQPFEEIGIEKPSAYRGLRHAALDPLAAAVRVLDGVSGRYETPGEALHDLRRHFVSIVQRVLAPEQHNQEIARMIKQSNPGYDATATGLLPGGEVPDGAEALLWGAQHSHKLLADRIVTRGDPRG